MSESAETRKKEPYQILSILYQNPFDILLHLNVLQTRITNDLCPRGLERVNLWTIFHIR